MVAAPVDAPAETSRTPAIDVSDDLAGTAGRDDALRMRDEDSAPAFLRSARRSRDADEDGLSIPEAISTDADEGLVATPETQAEQPRPRAPRAPRTPRAAGTAGGTAAETGAAPRARRRKADEPAPESATETAPETASEE